MSLQGQTGLWGGVGGGIVGGSAAPPLYDWQTSTFLPTPAYGPGGPSTASLDSQHSGRNYSTNYFKASNGIAYVRMPYKANYRIKVFGAYGGPSNPYDGTESTRAGRPWYLDITTEIEHGTWIGVLVGQKGGYNDGSGESGGGGGGGTFVFKVNSDEETNATFTGAHIQTCPLTPIVVASGGNGSSWTGWVLPGVNARPQISPASATDWIPTYAATITSPGYQNFGRGGMGGSFDYTPYWWVAPGITYWTGFDTNTKQTSGAPLKDSNGKIHAESGVGGIQDGGSYGSWPNNANSAPATAAGSHGGFGGGGGSRYEGGGGGGYWGGATNKTNDYNTLWVFGGQSYVAPGSTVNATSLASSQVTVPDSLRGTKQSYPWNANLDGSCDISEV